MQLNWETKILIIIFSAKHYPKAIDQYLQKEIEFGAILRPLDPSEDLKIYCSPLMTRSKDLDKHEFILDLSYPQGGSVNDFVMAVNSH